MSQNTQSQPAATPAAHNWLSIAARWSQDVIVSGQSTLTLASTSGRGFLALEPRDEPSGESQATDGWVPFRLRTKYPPAAPISLADAPYLLVVRVSADAAERINFRRWLDEEHCRRQVSLPGVNCYLGYEQEGSEHSFLNLWSIDEPSIGDSDAWMRVRDTPWWARLSHVPANADRDVYRMTASG